MGFRIPHVSTASEETDCSALPLAEPPPRREFHLRNLRPRRSDERGVDQFKEVSSVGDQLRRSEYYHPDLGYFPVIDSLPLAHPPPDQPSGILLIFQIIRNRSHHDVNIASLDKVDGLKISPDTRRYYVVITSGGVHLKITAPMKCAEVKVRQGYHLTKCFRFIVTPLPWMDYSKTKRSDSH